MKHFEQQPIVWNTYGLSLIVNHESFFSQKTFFVKRIGKRIGLIVPWEPFFLIRKNRNLCRIYRII